MKKLIALFLAVGMLLLVGCKNTVPPEENPNQPFGYTEEDLAEIIVEDKTRYIAIDMSNNDRLRGILTNLTHGTEPAEKDVLRIIKFRLIIGGKTMHVCEDNTVRYEDGDMYPVDPLLLNYLTVMLVGDVKSLDATMGENAKVYNSSGQVAEVTDIPAFLDDLNGLGVIELWEITDFTFGTEDYRIETGHDSIKIYGDFIVIGETAYAVVEGDFGFLSDLDFSSSSGGFLPWI